MYGAEAAAAAPAVPIVGAGHAIGCLALMLAAVRTCRPRQRGRTGRAAAAARASRRPGGGETHARPAARAALLTRLVHWPLVELLLEPLAWWSAWRACGASRNGRQGDQFADAACRSLVATLDADGPAVGDEPIDLLLAPL